MALSFISVPFFINREESVGVILIDSGLEFFQGKFDIEFFVNSINGVIPLVEGFYTSETVLFV